MSTSILFHAFNLKGIKYISTIFSGTTIFFRAEMDCSVKCPICGKRHTIYRGQKTRDFLMPPIGRKKCVLNLTLHRLECKECGNLWWPDLSFMDGKHRYVRAFILTVLDLLKFGTIQSVADYMGVGWDMIKSIHKPKLSASKFKSCVSDD
jgi:transposase